MHTAWSVMLFLISNIFENSLKTRAVEERRKTLQFRNLLLLPYIEPAYNTVLDITQVFIGLIHFSQEKILKNLSVGRCNQFECFSYSV